MIDEAALAAWLRELDLDISPPLELRRIGKGKSNLTLLLGDGAGRRWVLRRAPAGPLVASAHDIPREAGILEALAGTQVPSPRPLALMPAWTVSDAPVLLMEYVEGSAIDGAAVAEVLEPSVRGRIGPALAATLASIHAVDLDGTGLANLAPHGEYAQRQIRRWRRQWDASRSRDLPLVDELAERLVRAAPAQTETCLVHGDYHLLNSLIDSATGAVTGILDWELSTLGDPLADLGTLLAYWSAEGDHPLGAPYDVTALPDFSTPSELVRAYAESSGRDVATIDFWRALAYWKVAIIADGVESRHRADPTNPPGLGAGGVELLLERAAAALGA